jgi:hypothetical protein
MSIHHSRVILYDPKVFHYIFMARFYGLQGEHHDYRLLLNDSKESSANQS